MFKRTSIYIKTHNITKLRYFGKTCQEDVAKYTGSGKYWKNHINKHGYNVETFVIRVFNENERAECMKYCLEFSRMHNIVKSKGWANLIDENGIDGAIFGSKLSEKTKEKMRGIQRIVKCPHCNKTGGVGAMKRYHFVNCENEIPLDLMDLQLDSFKLNPPVEKTLDELVLSLNRFAN